VPNFFEADMVFFRIKKIKGKEYAYLVENEWKKKSSRQKVKNYLGRIYRVDLKESADFLQFIKVEGFEKYVNENDIKKIIKDLIEWELFRFGVDRNIFLIDLNNKKVQKSKKNAVLLINDGFMCGLTLRNLLEFKTEDQERDGFRLARAFVEAGIKVPQEVFIGLFGKLYKQTT